jgi:Protein of unknown function/Domain of unknown function (DUF1835)
LEKSSEFFRRGSAMTQTIAHFVFAPSGAGCLVQALRKAGRDDVVVASFDNLSFGPIDPSDPSARAQWLENQLGRIDREDAARSERVWDEARFPGHRKVAWLTRRSAAEYAGFLDWLWHRGDTPCDVVDLTEVKVSYPDSPHRPPSLAIGLGMLHHDKICSDKLWDLAKPLPMTERLRYRELWQRLLSENAALRVIDGNELISAPVSFFDSRLMSYLTKDWQMVAKVVAPAMISDMDHDSIQIDAMFLAARINRLAENGRLEIRGESALEITRSEVRLPGALLPDDPAADEL